MAPRSASLRRRPSQARGEARLDRILDAAAKLLGESGVEALTTNAIAVTAGTSVGSIYEYFAGREAVAVALAERLADRYEASPFIVPTPSALAAAVVDRIAEWWAAEPAISTLWWQSGDTSRLGPAGGLLAERVVASTAAGMADRTQSANNSRVRRAAEVATGTVAGLLHGAGRGGDREVLRRTAALMLGAYFAAELPAVAPADLDGQPAEPQRAHGAGRPAGPSSRALEGRQRILDAAVDRLVAEGYRGATTLAIQAGAGVSRGRLLHQFPSRDLLLVAAAGHLAEQRVRATRQRVLQVVQADREGVSRIDHVVELMWASYQEPHYWAASELWLAARTNAEIADALRPYERRLGATIRAAVAEMFGVPYADSPFFAMLRDVLLTSMRGLAATYAFERRDPARDPHVETWKQLAHLVLMPAPGASRRNSQA